MYEALSEELTKQQTEEYLLRIGINEIPDVTRTNLDKIVDAHQLSVPFENLDLYDLKKGVIKLETAALYEKVVVNRRGGYCFELNSLFFRLLKSIGFTVRPSQARVLRGKSEKTPPLHRSTIVTIDKTDLFCDVGFGSDMPRTSLELKEGEINTDGGIYIFSFISEDWVILKKRKENEDSNLLEISLREHFDVDFVAPNFYTSHNPESMFLKNRSVSLRRKDGHASISDSTFKLVQNGQETLEEVLVRSRLDEILKEYFGIIMPII